MIWVLALPFLLWWHIRHRDRGKAVYVYDCGDYQLHVSTSQGGCL